MTQDEIIEMARQAGMMDTWDGWVSRSVYKASGLQTEDLIAFAKLVAAKEREACAKDCEDIDSSSDYYGERVELVCAEVIRARGEA